MADESFADESFLEYEMHADLARERGQIQPDRGATSAQPLGIEQRSDAVHEPIELDVLFAETAQYRHVVVAMTCPVGYPGTPLEFILYPQNASVSRFGPHVAGCVARTFFAVNANTPTVRRVVGV